MIRVYDKDYSSNLHLNSNGLKTIQPIKCIETKSETEWFIDVEIDDSYLSFIEHMNVVVVRTKQGLFQPFRIRNPKLNKHVISFTAKHIFFDLENYFLNDLTFTDYNGLTALNKVLTDAIPTMPYTVMSDVTSTISYSVQRVSVASAILELVERYNAHLVLDNYNINIKASIGTNRGVEIRQGKNLEDLTINENWDNVVTKIIPTCGDRVYSAINADISYDVPYIKAIPFESDKTTDLDIEADIIAQATEYLNENKYPLVNYTVKSDILQEVQLGDVIRVFGKIELDTNVIAYTFNVLTQRITSVEFGNYRQNVKNLLNSFKSIDEFKQSSKQYNQLVSDQSKVIQEQTNLINGLYKNGYVVINDNEIFIVDVLPKESATYVLRINLGGMGFSSSGIEGPFTTAWTIDGVFNADFIQTGQLNGINMKIGADNNVFKADSNGIYLGNNLFADAPFKVAMDGTGKIGGFNFDGNKLFSSGGTGKYVAMAPNYYYGSNYWAFWAGGPNPSASVPFGVTMDGTLYARTIYSTNFKIYEPYLGSNTGYIEGSYLKFVDSTSLIALYFIKSSNKGFIWNTGRITCNTDFSPTNSNTYNLGDSATRWKYIYLNYAPDVSSDIRLKENVEIVENQFNDVILNTEVISYNLIGDDKKALGINANKFYEQFKDKSKYTVSQDDNGYFGVRYESFIPMMIKTIQELNMRVIALEGGK